MKRAIDNATKVITYHSITAKPSIKEGNQTAKDKAFYEKNEYNKWVDDSYMLMGKAYMYQGEFFLAAETFKHVLVTFPEDLTASQNYFQGRYGQVTMSAEGRLFNPTNTYRPLTDEARAMAAENWRRMMVPDTGLVGRILLEKNLPR